MGEMGRKEWLSDHPLCTSYIAVSAGYVTNSGTDHLRSVQQEFEISVEFHNGEDNGSIDYLIRDKEEVKEALEAISRVRKALDFLEGRIKEECVDLMEESDGEAAEGTTEGLERPRICLNEVNKGNNETEANGSPTPSGEKG